MIAGQVRLKLGIKIPYPEEASITEMVSNYTNQDYGHKMVNLIP